MLAFFIFNFLFVLLQGFFLFFDVAGLGGG
jgi:hypothetical protein